MPVSRNDSRKAEACTDSEGSTGYAPGPAAHDTDFGLQYGDGEFLVLPDPEYRLEFVGDSITSGEGTMGPVGEEDWISAFFSAENTYPRMVSDALSAEYRVVSQSGWGIVTGWDGIVENKIPPYYKQVCGLLTGERNASLGALEDYDFKAWQPDA